MKSRNPKYKYNHGQHVKKREDQLTELSKKTAGSGLRPDRCHLSHGTQSALHAPSECFVL